MKSLIITLVFSIFLTPSLIGQNSTKKKAEISVTPNLKSHYCEGITFIPGRSFTKYWPYFDKYLSEDTTLLYPARESKGEFPKRDSVASFYISDHEVTNAEYREFVNWVRDSIARSLLFKRNDHQWGRYTNTVTKNKDHTGQYFVLNWDTKLDYNVIDVAILLDEIYVPKEEQYESKKIIDVRKLNYNYDDIRNGDTISTSINIYPDTLCWATEFPYANFWSMVNYYFWNKAYDNYPVVGISWTQIQAYCDWRTKRYMEEISKMGSKKKSKYIGVKFTLPNNNQWSYACEPDDIYQQPYAKNENGCYPSNFGNIYLNSGILIKDYRDDGEFLTAEVKDYLENVFGLYNMYGNVSEWIQDNPTARPNNFFENLMDIGFYPFLSLEEMRATPQELYITDPYTKTTQLVTKNSPEHKRILEKRLQFYNISPNATVDEILKNYIAFHSVDSSFRNKILNLQIKDGINSTEKQEQKQSTDKKTDLTEDTSVIIEEIPFANYDNPLELYNNYSGCFETDDKIWAEQILVRLIREFKHNWEVIERAELIENQVMEIKQNFGVVEQAEQIQILSNEDAIKTCRLVKGGSWANQAHYLNTVCNEVYHESITSCKIGFRVVMEASVIEENCWKNWTAKDRKKLKKYRKNH